MEIDIIKENQELIKKITGYTDNLVEIIFVEDIYDYVKNDDEEYAKRLENQKDSLFGLCYVTKSNKMILLAKRGMGATTEISMIHEQIHALDFLSLSVYKNEEDLRKLQEIFQFHYWSEFHATYISYKFMIQNNGYEKDVYYFMEQLTGRMEKFLEKKKLFLEDAVDFSVRIFGEYLAAWETEKNEFPKFPLHLFIDRNFGRLCNYLYDHLTFDSIKDNLDELENFFRRIENNSKKNNFEETGNNPFDI